jgi:excisionase family DNA binding protein
MNLYEAEHLTIAEATQCAGIGRTKLYELLQTGQIGAVKLGRRTFVKADSLRTFLAKLPQFGRPS